MDIALLSKELGKEESKLVNWTRSLKELLGPSKALKEEEAGSYAYGTKEVKQLEVAIKTTRIHYMDSLEEKLLPIPSPNKKG